MFEGETLHPITMAISHPPSKQAAVKRECAQKEEKRASVCWETLQHTAGDDEDDDGERTDGLKGR